MIVDPSVVGGVVAKVGDEIFDGSVRSRCQEAREQPDRNDHKERVNPMAVDELNFDPKDIAEALRKNVRASRPRSSAKRSAAWSRPATASRA